jgi:hypothetical protein
VRFELAQVPLIVLCHCSICRKANGAPFESGASVPAADFTLRTGEDLIQIFESSPGVRRAFCRVCGSRAPSESRDRDVYFVPAGLLDDDPGVKPALHMFVGSKAPWWDITDDLPQFEEWVPGYAPDDQK